MLQQTLGAFHIKADLELDLMSSNQGLSEITARLLEGIDRVVQEVQPAWILAQGDTTTVMAGALVAYYRKSKFGHVEAGLRTNNLYSPFPEELNRRVADLVATRHFCPTDDAARNLEREGIAKERIQITGNTVVDALLEVAGRPYDWTKGPLARVPRDRRLIVVTAHRRESFGEPLHEVCLALGTLARQFAGEKVHIVFPVHLNPNVRQPVHELLGGEPNIQLLEPLEYPAMVHLMKHASLILTDSGGIQEEAPSLKVPVLVMRDTTERPEGVQAGAVRLVGTNASTIVAEASSLLRNEKARLAMCSGANPYGDGKAAQRIVHELLSHFT